VTILKEDQYWDSVARRWTTKNYKNQIFAEHKRATYLKLLENWLESNGSHIVLKTDLFDEAFSHEQYLFETSWACSTIVMDISSDIVVKAREVARLREVDCYDYICCDVKALPFKDDCFDWIVSDSTLDHFPSETHIITALGDISRVLKTGGVLVLILDNKTCITYTPYFFIRFWMWLGLTPYFVGKTLSLNRLKSILESLNLTIEDSTTIFHYPHPDIIIRGCESFIHRICGDRLNNVIRWVFTTLERLENRKTKFITGRYIAVKAVKQ
jgi:SAM-dependent methyltransferase